MHTSAPEKSVSEKIHVGIAGWSYADWNGIVYPASGIRDPLAYIAAFFDVIEINSTFYRTPSPSTAASWVRRTERHPPLSFTAKLSQSVTHQRDLSEDLVREFHAGLAPLRNSGRLKHLLAQFRWDFTDSPENRAHLCNIRDAFSDLAHLTLELRHNSWEAPESLAFLRAMDVTVANLDYPQSKTAFSLQHCNVGQDAYLRLHGRNARAWFDSKAGRDETYNYCYSEDEIEEIVERAVSLAGMSRSLTLIANNHYKGKEVMNALEIKSRITGRKLDVPPDLATQYPRLRKIARTPPPTPPVQPDLF